MDLKNILDVIESNLTGNDERDMQYLIGQIKSYQALENGALVVEGITNIMNRRLDKDTKQKLLDKAKDNLEKRRKIYKDGRDKLGKNDFKGAQKCFEFLLDTCPIVALHEQKPELKMFEFNNLFESLLYFSQFQKEKVQVRPMEEPLASFYYNLAYTQCRSSEPDKGLVTLQKALSFNPVHIGVRILQCEISLQKHDMPTFYDCAMEAFKIAYRPAELGRIFWLMGDYFGIIKQKSEAIACYLMAKEYTQSELLDKNLHVVEKYPGEPVIFEKREDLLRFLEMSGMPTGASEMVIATIKLGMDKAVEKNDDKTLKYFMNIGYQLTKDPIYQVNEQNIMQ